jgi:hypothetical protein
MLQSVPSEFNIREMVEKLLQQNDFEKMRARSMDVDDFLRF